MAYRDSRAITASCGATQAQLALNTGLTVWDQRDVFAKLGG